MAEALKVTWHQGHFDRTFKRYMEHTSRDLVTAINTKAYFVARKAVWFTDKADKGKIRSALIQTVQVPSKKNPSVMRNRRVMTQARDYEAPLAAVIINARRGRKGDKGLYGARMKTAIRDLLAARIRSVAYIKSGWLPAIRELAKYADKKGQPTVDSTAKQVGNAKGAAIPAGRGAVVAVAKIINEAWTKHGKEDALVRVGSKGLQRAFNDETQSMKTYIEDKMKAAIDEFNAANKP